MLMFPKEKTKKKRKKHRASILQRKEDRVCYLCAKLYDDCRQHKVIHEHHIFFGPDRQKSEEYGLKVYLCIEHHELGKEAVHKNKNINKILKQDGQKAFEGQIGSREQFIEIFGKNYL